MSLPFLALSVDRKCCIYLGMSQRYSCRNVTDGWRCFHNVHLRHANYVATTKIFLAVGLVMQKPSNTRVDLVNFEIQIHLLPRDNLNATFLPPRETKKTKKNICVCVCVCVCNWDLQLDSTTKELWWQVPTQTLYVSITVILLAVPTVQSHPQSGHLTKVSLD